MKFLFVIGLLRTAKRQRQEKAMSGRVRRDTYRAAWRLRLDYSKRCLPPIGGVFVPRCPPFPPLRSPRCLSGPRLSNKHCPVESGRPRRGSLTNNEACAGEQREVTLGGASSNVLPSLRALRGAVECFVDGGVSAGAGTASFLPPPGCRGRGNETRVLLTLIKDGLGGIGTY